MNRDGKVSASELSALLNAAGIKLSDAQVQWIINRADKDGDGLLDIEELKQLIKAAMTITKLVKKPTVPE